MVLGVSRRVYGKDSASLVIADSAGQRADGSAGRAETYRSFDLDLAAITTVGAVHVVAHRRNGIAEGRILSGSSPDEHLLVTGRQVIVSYRRWCATGPGVCGSLAAYLYSADLCQHAADSVGELIVRASECCRDVYGTTAVEEEPSIVFGAEISGYLVIHDIARGPARCAYAGVCNSGRHLS